MKTVLLTGFSGFLGTHVLNFLKINKYNIIKVGRNTNADIQCDLSLNKLPKVDVDIVIHVAGKAHVIPKTDEEKEDFFKVNYLGTKNLLKGLGLKELKTIVFISTVAVYGKEIGELITETTPLKGSTPYALSKIKAENAVIDFGIKNKVNIVVLRLPLITGENPVGNLKSIINAIQKGYYFRVGKGEAKKSLIAASDIANMIPELINLNGVYNLTDTKNPTISEIDSIIAKKFNKKIPIFLLKWIGKIGDIFTFFPFNSSKFHKLTKSLTFSNEKILKEINYKPSRGLSDIIL